MSENLDLLGDPIPEGFGGRGRPSHNPTPRNRLKVRVLLGLGHEIGDIAAALRVSKPTLRKHYSSELRFREEARMSLKGELVMTTMERAAAGDASMMRQAFRLIEKAEIDVAGLTRAMKKAKLGKKEQAKQDALAPTPGTPLGDLMARRTNVRDLDG